MGSSEKVVSVVVSVLLLVTTYVPAFIIVSILVMTNPGFASAVESMPWLPVPIIIVVTLITATLLIIRIGRGELSRYGLTLPQWSGLWKPILMGLIFGALIHLVERSLSIESTLMGEPPLLYGVLLFWISAPIQEETIFRGLFQGHLALHVGGSLRIGNWRLPIPVLIGAVAFSLVHLGLFSTGAEIKAVALTLVGAFILGIIAGHLRAQEGSLVGPIIVHALFNITGVFVGA